MSDATITTRHVGQVQFITICRPEAGNAINAALVRELTAALDEDRRGATVVVIEGNHEVFCTGADFSEVAQSGDRQSEAFEDTAALYDLWQHLATGPFISIAHVEGKALAGGVGFVAACDIAIAGDGATFSLPEMLFGLMPACVYPFLMSKVGPQHANFMALSAQTLSASQARDIGLVDAAGENSGDLLRRHLLKVRQIPGIAIERFKKYRSEISPALQLCRRPALEANRVAFSDSKTLETISRFRETGLIERKE